MYNKKNNCVSQKHLQKLLAVHTPTIIQNHSSKWYLFVENFEDQVLIYCVRKTVSNPIDFEVSNPNHDSKPKSVHLQIEKLTQVYAKWNYLKLGPRGACLTVVL